VRAFRLESERLDIGSIESYHDADRLLSREMVPGTGSSQR
jgi:hypothetical protein